MEKGSNSTILIVAADGTRLYSLKKKTVVAQIVVQVVVVVGLQETEVLFSSSLLRGFVTFFDE